MQLPHLAKAVASLPATGEVRGLPPHFDRYSGFVPVLPFSPLRAQFRFAIAGGPTTKLHQVSFQLHQDLAKELDIKSYRRIPVLSVTPGTRTKRTTDLCPWLDGDIADSRVMDQDGGAQVAPYELCTKLMNAAVEQGAELRIGTVEGCEKDVDSDPATVTHVKVDGELVPCKAFVCTMGPWAALAQDWFNVPVPMTGIKSTSIVFKDDSKDVEPFALFCGEDDRFGTHLEVYPRNSGEVYLCGIGGSEYVDGERLRKGEYPPGEVHADPARVEAATNSFSTMSKRLGGKPETVQACMRPCPPDALPYMGKVEGFKNAYMSAGHNVSGRHPNTCCLCRLRRPACHFTLCVWCVCADDASAHAVLGHLVGTRLGSGHVRAPPRWREQMHRH